MNTIPELKIFVEKCQQHIVKKTIKLPYPLTTELWSRKERNEERFRMNEITTEHIKLNSSTVYENIGLNKEFFQHVTHT